MNANHERDDKAPTPAGEDVDRLLDEDDEREAIGLSPDDQDIDIVDWASDNSFPASDPPPWTPGTI